METEGEEEEGEEEEKARRLFLREKDCSAWAKCIGRGSGVLDSVVSMVTDIMLEAVVSCEPGRSA